MVRAVLGTVNNFTLVGNRRARELVQRKKSQRVVRYIKMARATSRVFTGLYLPRKTPRRVLASPNGKKCIDCRTTASWTNLTKHLKKGWSLSATETVSLAGSSQSRLTFQGLWRQVSITHVGGWSKFIAVVSILGNDYQKRRLPRDCGRT